MRLSGLYAMRGRLQLLVVLSVCVGARAQYEHTVKVPETIPAPTPPPNYTPPPYDGVLDKGEPGEQKAPEKGAEAPSIEPEHATPPPSEVPSPESSAPEPKAPEPSAQEPSATEAPAPESPQTSEPSAPENTAPETPENKVPEPSEPEPKAPEPSVPEPSGPKEGEEQKVEEVPAPTESLCIDDVLFVLDSTGSVRTFYEDQKNYMISLVESLNVSPEGQHVGLVKYSSHRRLRTLIELDVGIQKDLVLRKVKDVTFNGGITETGAALRYVKTALEKRRPDKKTAVVILTDGFSFDDVVEPAKEVRSLPGVVVFAAGLAHPVVREVLVDITGDVSRVLLGEEGKTQLITALKC